MPSCLRFTDQLAGGDASGRTVAIRAIPRALRAGFATIALGVGFAIPSGALVACRPLRALGAETRIAGHPAGALTLRFAEPCVVLPGGAPMGRPSGAPSHVLPAGRYRSAFEDDGGVYFRSETGISVTEPALRGTRSRAGGVYLARDGKSAWEYRGDVDGIGFRQPLPRHCHFELEPGAGANDPTSPGIERSPREAQ